MSALHCPTPERFSYRVLLLRERYLISIDAIQSSDRIYEFMCIHPVTPPLCLSILSPLNENKEKKQPSDFKKQEPLQEDIVEYGIDDED